MVIGITLIIGIVIGCTITKILQKNKNTTNTPDYSKLIKRCIEEANKDLSNCGKKKHSNKS